MLENGHGASAGTNTRLSASRRERERGIRLRAARLSPQREALSSCCCWEISCSNAARRDIANYFGISRRSSSGNASLSAVENDEGGEVTFSDDEVSDRRIRPAENRELRGEPRLANDETQVSSYISSVTRGSAAADRDFSIEESLHPYFLDSLPPPPSPSRWRRAERIPDNRNHSTKAVEIPHSLLIDLPLATLETTTTTANDRASDESE